MIKTFNKKVENIISRRGSSKRNWSIFNFQKDVKRGGFTLIEVVAVIAILGILAAVILPNVNGYIKEAKKVKVVDQCRKVVMAAESYKLRNDELAKTTTLETINGMPAVDKYLDQVDLSKLPEKTTLKQCYDIVNGSEFDIEGTNDILKIASSTSATPLTP